MNVKLNFNFSKKGLNTKQTIDGVEHLQKHFPKYVEGATTTIQ